MAKINISFDTESQSFDVNIDGDKMDNVTDATVCQHDYVDLDGEAKKMFMVRVTSMEDDGEYAQKQNSVIFMSKAADSEKLGVKSKYEGLVKIVKSSDDLDSDVTKYLGG